MRAEPRQLTGLAPAGKRAKSTTQKAEKYEPRVDIFGAVGFDRPLARETVTSSQRKRITNTRTGVKGVKGYIGENFLKKEAGTTNQSNGSERSDCMYGQRAGF